MDLKGRTLSLNVRQFVTLVAHVPVQTRPNQSIWKTGLSVNFRCSSFFRLSRRIVHNDHIESELENHIKCVCKVPVDLLNTEFYGNRAFHKHSTIHECQYFQSRFNCAIATEPNQSSLQPWNIILLKRCK